MHLRRAEKAAELPQFLLPPKKRRKLDEGLKRRDFRNIPLSLLR